MKYTSSEAWRRNVERAADEIQRGRAVLMQGENSAALVLALEHTPVAAAVSSAVRPGCVVLPAATARQIGYDTGAEGVVRFAVDVVDGDSGFTLAEPSGKSAHVVAGDEEDEAARLLARFSGLAPSALVCPLQAYDDVTGIVRVESQDILRYAGLKPSLERVTPEAVNLPIDSAPDARVMAFRDTLTQGTHLAVMVGDLALQPAPLVRLHSSCVTGDILGSLRCDCGGQLQAALAAIAKSGCGVLLYLNQEGRGIGLVNKLRAYGLQDQGMDTVDANIMLGFSPDERDFSIAAQLLRALGVTAVRLLTNNPAKTEAIQKHGIVVIERVALVMETNAHNEAYMATKAARMRHLL